MQLTSDIKIRKNAASRISEVDFKNLEFGKHVTDHMLVADFENNSWQTAEIMPYAPLSLDPVTLALHYGQTVFEGMKAFRMKDGQVNIFRPYKHFERFNISLTRMCMPNVPEELFINGLHKLIALDQEWIPGEEGSSLYIRPFMFASEARFGVKASASYKFMIVAGPVGPYYSKPLHVKVEREYVRAAPGGTGYAKCGGNYGGAFYPTQLAKDEGYDQVIWTDAVSHNYLEESGTTNIMLVISGKLVTPSLSSSILDGVTRDSILTLAADLGYETEERAISVDELRNALKNETISEAFGAGTAAVIAPIKSIGIDGIIFELPPVNNSQLMMMVKKKLSDIRRGYEPDVHEWNYLVS
jgi:branched-chain amino acid aminotransferase